MSIDDAVNLMRGKPKTKLELTLVRSGEPKPIVVQLTRDIIRVESVKVRGIDDTNFAYVRVNSFDKNVTLGGSAGGELITVNGATADVKVVVGTTKSVDGEAATTGSFTIGNALATSDTAYNLTGSVTVNKDSALNVNGQTTVTGGVELNSGAVNVGNGTLVSNITASGTSAITGAAQVEKLTASDTNTVINIGNADKAGNVTVKETALNGATVFLDPAWKDGAEITDASKMAVAGKDGKVTGGGTIKLPETVKVIGENAFYMCSNLYSIEFNEGLEKVENKAFLKCTNLSALEFPETLTEIGVDSFSYCDSLTHLEIPSSVKSIGDYAFFSTSSSIDKIVVHQPNADSLTLGKDWIPNKKNNVREKVTVEYTG